MTTISDLDKNTVIVTFENPTELERLIIQKLRQIEKTGGIDETLPFTGGEIDFSKKTYEELVLLDECPFLNASEKAQVKRYLEEKKPKNTPKTNFYGGSSGGSTYRGKTVEELRKANEGIVW